MPEHEILYGRPTGRLCIDPDAWAVTAILFALVRPDTELTNLDFRGL